MSEISVVGNQDQAIRKPVSLQDGSYFYLSQKELLICETFLASRGNYAECVRAVQAKFKKVHAPMTIKRWIETRSLIKRYLEERGKTLAEIAGFTEDDWKLKGIRAIKGSEKMDAVQAQVWKEYGKLEFKKGEGGGTQFNQQINFVQQNGEK